MPPAKASVFPGEHIVPNPEATMRDQVREVLRSSIPQCTTEETTMAPA